MISLYRDVIDPRKLKPCFLLSAISAVLLCVAALDGKWIRGIYAPFVNERLIPAAYGQDGLSLLVAPVIIISLYFVERGSLKGGDMYSRGFSWSRR